MNADLRKALLFSVMLNESTDKGGKKNLLVYVRYPEKGRFVTKFWTVLEVERWRRSRQTLSLQLACMLPRL
jgi:hypothetical protein